MQILTSKRYVVKFARLFREVSFRSLAYDLLPVVSKAETVPKHTGQASRGLTAATTG